MSDDDAISAAIERVEAARNATSCARPGCGHMRCSHTLNHDGVRSPCFCDDCDDFIYPMAVVDGPVGTVAVERVLGLCDRRGCKERAVATRVCSHPTCDKTFRRCVTHDGAAGLGRSLHSHDALQHPKNKRK